MKTFLRISFFFFLVTQICFGQIGYENKNTHKLKIGNKKIPISTYNGESPNGRQLKLIENVLTEDFLVNDDTTGNHVFHNWPTIAMDGSGNFVVAWADDRNVNSDIYFQRYDSSGTTQGVNTKVNDDVGTTWQGCPTIVMDVADNFVIAWNDWRNGNADIYFQRFNSSGTAQGVNTKANDDGGSVEQVSSSPIAMDGAGNFVISWKDWRNGNPDIYFQRFNTDGTAQGVNTKANDDAGSANQSSPTIAMDGIGNFVIAWTDDRNDVDSISDIYFQRFNTEGTAQGVNGKANDDAGSANQSSPTIAMDGAGNFVIAWNDARNGNSDVYFQRYNSSGTAQGINIKANDNVPSLGVPAIAMDGSSNFVIAWQDWQDYNVPNDVYFQRFNSDGTAQGVNTKVNDDTANTQYSLCGYMPTTIAMNGSGNFVIAWQDWRNGYADIYLQRFNLSGIAQGVNTKANDDAGSLMQYHPTIAINEAGNFVSAWMDKRNGNSDVYFQRFNSDGTAQGVNTKANDDTGNEEPFETPTIAMDGGGNIVIAWWDDRNGNADVYFQRFNSSGTSQGVNTKVNNDTTSAGQVFPTIAVDGVGNFVIAWMDWSDIYFQRFNSDGVPQGVNTKVNDDVVSADQNFPTIAMDGTGNFVITWNDARNGNSDVYFQRYNPSGIAQGINIKANDDLGTAYQQLNPRIAMNATGNFVIAWNDARNGNSDFYFQRFNSSGTAQGVNTKANDDVWIVEPFEAPAIAIDGSGNFVIAWTDYRYGVNNPDIIGQRYFANGTLNGSNYRIVADGPNYCETNPAVAANNSQIVFAWVDNRRSKGWDIYGKIVGWDWNGVTSVLEDGNNLPKEFSLFQNYPNPFNSTSVIKYSIPKSSQVTLKIFNTLGEEIETLVNSEKPVGTYELNWNAANLPSGVYFYRLQAGDFVQTRKMILLK